MPDSGGGGAPAKGRASGRPGSAPFRARVAVTSSAGEVLKKLLVIPAVLLGVAVLYVLASGREGPEQAPPAEEARTVRVIAAPRVEIVPRAVGYGYVTPGMVWEAVAEVSGKVVETHPRLKKGEILPAGAVLLRIDPMDYRLAITQIEANIRSARAELAELKVREENTRASLEIEENALRLSRKDLERKRELLKRGNVSQAAVDQEERNVLTQEQSVQGLRNTLNLIPAEREALEAKLALYQAQLEAARRNLERTTIAVPFDARIAEVNVERAQFAKEGQIVAIADSIDVAEIGAQVPIEKFRNLLSPVVGDDGLSLADMDKLPELLGLSATVTLRSGDFTVEWEGRFARISDTIDPETRTVGVIIAVDDPYRQARLGYRPPLVKNMFVEVDLRGRPRPAGPVIPRSALHGSDVFIVGDDDRLIKRGVEVGFFQTNFVTVSRGLEAGERVVVSDLSPAIEGMLLDPVLDEALADRLAAEASGAAAIK
jgi:RND family efflux transporter MFP subunit